MADSRRTLMLLQTRLWNLDNCLCEALTASREGKTPVCLPVESFRLGAGFYVLSVSCRDEDETTTVQSVHANLASSRR